MRVFRVIIAAAFFVTLTAGNVFTSTLGAAPPKPDSPRLRWKGRTIKLAISNSLIRPSSNIKFDSDVMDAVLRSVQAWQNAADIEIVLEPSDRQSVSPSGLVGDGVSLITIAQTAENVLLFSKDPEAVSAKTRVFYNAKSFITEADIVLNPFQQFSTDGTFGTFDLQSTLTHELGHLLGLRHSSVLGSTMCESRSKNGAFGINDLSPRTLAESDLSSIRDLYGVTGEDSACCAAIVGRLVVEGSRAVKNVRVWAEEGRTGRVVAQVEAAGDGSFRLGGLPEATYSVFWEKKDDGTGVSFGELGPAAVVKGRTVELDDKILLRHSEIELDYLGINSQLADSALPLTAGRQYVLYLGGKGLDAKGLNVVFNSPYFKVAGQSSAHQDFGEGISVITVILTVDQNAPAGAYSIFAARADGSISSMIGALNID